jgi:hypothetical protein
MKKIAISRILDNEMNPRDFKNKTQRTRLNKLVKSISEHGLIMPPILYRKKGSKFYAPLDGHRRVKACRELGWSEIPYIGTREMGLPDEMTDPEALKYMFTAQDTTKAWGARDVLEVIGEAVDKKVDIFIPETMEQKTTTYGLSPDWLRGFVRGKTAVPKGWRKSIGWTVVWDIMTKTDNEKEIRQWVEAYMSRKLATRAELRKALKSEYT